MICNVPPAIGGAETTLDCSVCNAPLVNTFSCRSTSLTVAVGISASLAITVVCRQPILLAPNASASRNAAARVLSLLNMKFLLRNGWILQSEPLARLQTLGNQSLIAALARHFDRRLFKSRSSPHIRNGSPRLPEKSIRRNNDSI